MGQVGSVYSIYSFKTGFATDKKKRLHINTINSDTCHAAIALHQTTSTSCNLFITKHF